MEPDTCHTYDQNPQSAIPAKPCVMAGNTADICRDPVAHRYTIYRHRTRHIASAPAGNILRVPRMHTRRVHGAGDFREESVCTEMPRTMNAL